MKKGTMRWKEAKSEEIIKGRAIVINLPWSAEEEIRCLAIYALNKDDENRRFWEDIKNIWGRRQLKKPTCMIEIST